MLPTGNSRLSVRSKEGFTFVELVLVTVVLAILLVAIAPQFQQTAQRMRIEQSGFEFAQLLRYAHALAVSEGREAVWRWDANARRARVGLDGAGEDARDASSIPAGRLSQSAPLLEGASVRLARDGAGVACECVRFFPDGTGEPTCVYLSLRDQQVMIQVKGATSEILLAARPAPC